MTPSEVLTMINTQLPTNGSNEITAAVLRPVLTAMVNQINDLVGNGANLPDGSDTVIEAINNALPSSITIHTGTEDPNITPPSSFDVGDFYSQTASSVIIAFWQNNGIQWIEVLSRYEQKLRGVRTVSIGTDFKINDDVIIYNGSNPTHYIIFPDVETSQGRIITLVNLSGVMIITDEYLDLFSEEQVKIKEYFVIKLISDGTVWQQINNDDIPTGS